ncbi:MAG: hypothetical protein LBI55_03500 [Oscillospiraceae bacterium]|jgi:hypothetical protein|nr:hypothetical protein [Oscillospiraceae bacterium]
MNFKIFLASALACGQIVGGSGLIARAFDPKAYYEQIGEELTQEEKDGVARFHSLSRFHAWLGFKSVLQMEEDLVNGKQIFSDEKENEEFREALCNMRKLCGKDWRYSFQEFSVLFDKKIIEKLRSENQQIDESIKETEDIFEKTKTFVVEDLANNSGLSAGNKEVLIESVKNVKLIIPGVTQDKIFTFENCYTNVMNLKSEENSELAEDEIKCRESWLKNDPVMSRSEFQIFNPDIFYLQKQNIIVIQPGTIILQFLEKNPGNKRDMHCFIAQAIAHEFCHLIDSASPYYHLSCEFVKRPEIILEGQLEIDESSFVSRIKEEGGFFEIRDLEYYKKRFEKIREYFDNLRTGVNLSQEGEEEREMRIYGWLVQHETSADIFGTKIAEKVLNFEGVSRDEIIKAVVKYAFDFICPLDSIKPEFCSYPVGPYRFLAANDLIDEIDKDYQN